MNDADPARAIGAIDAAEFVVERVRSIAGSRWLQGCRRPSIACAAPSGAVRVIAENRLHRVGELESRALVGWADGRRVARVFSTAVSPAKVVELQAQGVRCVSLIPGEDEPSLEFALHDLRHLEKFFEPTHFRAQVGFFDMIHRAFGTRAWLEMDRGFDARWSEDRDAVLSDMNGCPIFLLAVLKMKLKMAVRRALAARRQQPPRQSGPLDDEELAHFDVALERYLDVFELHGEVREAARGISARRDSAGHGRVLLDRWSRSADSERVGDLRRTA